MPRKTNLKTQLLKTLALNQVLSAEAINLIAEERKQYFYLREILKDAVDERLIRKESVYEKTIKGSFTKQYYSITRKGMQKLICSSGAEWETYVEMETRRNADGIETEPLNSKQIHKLIRVNEARMISLRAGAKDGRQENDAFFFTDSPRVKQQILFQDTGDGKVNKIKDFDRCIFDGILDSKTRFLMMYSCCGVGKTWKKWNISKDLNIASFWNMTNSRFRYPVSTIYEESFEGILLVKNHVQFTQLYKDVAEKRRRTEQLGRGYKNFFAAPLTWEGAELIRFLMHTDLEEYDRMIAEYMSPKGYSQNTEYKPETYFLISPDQHLTINGTYLEIRRMQRAEEVYSSGLGYIPEILCFEWQVPFYKKTLPFSQLIVIPEKILQER